MVSHTHRPIQRLPRRSIVSQAGAAVHTGNRWPPSMEEAIYRSLTLNSVPGNHLLHHSYSLWRGNRSPKVWPQFQHINNTFLQDPILPNSHKVAFRGKLIREYLILHASECVLDSRIYVSCCLSSLLWLQRDTVFEGFKKSTRLRKYGTYGKHWQQHKQFNPLFSSTLMEEIFSIDSRLLSFSSHVLPHTDQMLSKTWKIDNVNVNVCEQAVKRSVSEGCVLDVSLCSWISNLN